VKFKIRFSTSHEKLGLFDNFQEANGLELLRLVKEESGLDVNPTTINKSCNLGFKSHTETLSVNGKYRDKILTHPRFTHFSEVNVVVPSGWFGQFVYEDVRIDREVSSDRWGVFKLLYFWFKHDILKQERTYQRTIVTNEVKWKDVLNDWVEAGMPDYWGITEERHIEMTMREIACEEERVRKAEEKAREEAKLLASKREVDLGYFADELKLMATKLKNIQEKYNS
jgi:hypothetical protein